MRWEDERYVRWYTRDTIDWHFLSFEAQGLMGLILRKADRAGILDLGRHGKKGVAAAVGHPNRADAVLLALEELLADGCVVIREDKLIIPNFIAAQETVSSDAQRKRDQRERDRDKAMADGFVGSRAGADVSVTVSRSQSQNVTVGHETGQSVTKRDQKSRHGVTAGHTESQAVTPNRAVPSVPSCAVPSEKQPREEPRVVFEGLRDQLEAEFQKQKHAPLLWDTSHERDLERVISSGRDEIVRRWSIAIGTPFPRCSSVRELVRNWNHYATDPPEKKPDRNAPIRAEDMKHSAITGEINDF